VTKKTLLGLIVVVCLFVLLLHRVDLQQLGAALLKVHISLLVIGLVPQLMVVWIKSIRWALAIRGATGRPVCRALSASLIGFAGNIIFPARLGELLRAGVIDKHNQIGRFVALTTIVLTQVFDLLVLIGYFLVVAIWAKSVLAGYLWEIGLLGGLIILTLGSLVALQQKAKLLCTVLLPMSCKLPEALTRPIILYTGLIAKGLSVLGKGRLLGGLLLLTMTVWALETASTYLILQAFHIKATLLMAAMLVVVLNLSVTVPITPGNLGITQAVSVFLLDAFGVTPASALAYSIGAQGTIQLLIVSLGLMCLYRERMSLNLLRQRSREVVDVPTSTIEVQ
jgi:glycosyltransferase 2 family protein